MSATIKIEFSDQASIALNNLIDAIGDFGGEEISRAMAAPTMEVVKAYYSEYGDKGGWENPSLPTHGAGRNPTNFAANMVTEWNDIRTSSDGFELVHTSRGPGKSPLALKIHGGTVKPKQAKALTIPLVPEAHGISAAEYEAQSGNNLFIPPGTGVLAENVESGNLRAIYTLKQSVTYEPWPGALPPSDLIAAGAIEGLNDYLDEEVFGVDGG